MIRLPYHYIKVKKMKKKNIVQTLATKNEIGTLLPLVIMCVIVTIINPSFIAVNNLIDIFRTTSYYLVVGAPHTLCQNIFCNLVVFLPIFSSYTVNSV